MESITMHRPLKVLALLALSLICASRVSAETLQVGIEHSEYLPPVSQSTGSPQGYTSGITQREAPKSEPIIEWFQMPRTMAGKWTKRGDITVDVTELRTGMTRQVGAWTDNEMTMTLGHQMDRAGNIWHVNILPTERDSISNGKMVRFLTVRQSCEKSDPSVLCTRTRYVITETYGGSGQIADMFQQESLNRYSILPTGELQNLSSNRVFTYSGQPVRDGTLQSKFRKVAAFEPMAELSGVDLASSLNRYLIALGHTELVTSVGSQSQLPMQNMQPQYQPQGQPQYQQQYQQYQPQGQPQYQQQYQPQQPQGQPQYQPQYR